MLNSSDSISSRPKRALRRAALGLAAVAALLLAVAPASADHKRYRRHHYGHRPHVRAYVALPPIPIPFPPFFPVPVVRHRYYDDYGYYDDYRYRRHRHHHHCDDDCDDYGCNY